jgi:hypothetical protein
MKTLFLDIETIPCQAPGALEEAKANVKPPGSMSKPETIAKWMVDNADSAAEEQWRKTSFDGGRGEILCIGYAVDDGPVSIISRTIDESERDLLVLFYLTMESAGIDILTTIVGHYVKDFDLRFIFHRSVINCVRPSFPLRNEKRYGDYVFDTMLAWAGWGNRISLKNLCAVLGIPAKEGEIDGSKVWDFAKAGRYDEINEYCKSDVEAVREVYKRLTFS